MIVTPGLIKATVIAVVVSLSFATVVMAVVVVDFIKTKGWRKRRWYKKGSRYHFE